ncbi:MAG: hypothetical protein NC336_09970 [Clostridium sp.]|nr:hypothetical protein [Clostridium sp.]
MTDSRKLLTKLLMRNISVVQTAAYVAALLAGLAILLAGVTFAGDIASMSGRQSNRGIFLTLSKPAGGFPGSPVATFSPEEIGRIAATDGVVDVGGFSRADFDVNARIGGGFGGGSTALFLEAVPPRFVDERISGFSYDPVGRDSATVPVIIPRDYLTLYNYGFAPARGLPTVTERMLAMIPVELSVSGAGRQQIFRAKIVGCSDRLNTIAVPERFVEYADSLFGDRTGALSAPSRLIVEAEPGSDVSPRLAAMGYETGGGSIADGEIGRILKVSGGVVAAVGTAIVLLSLLLLTVSIHLLLYKNRLTLHRLMIAGYSPRQVIRPYAVAVSAVNLATTVCSLVLLLSIRPLWSGPLGIDTPALLPLLAAAGFFAAITTANLLTIRRNILGAFRIN